MPENKENSLFLKFLCVNTVVDPGGVGGRAVLLRYKKNGDQHSHDSTSNVTDIKFYGTS